MNVMAKAQREPLGQAASPPDGSSASEGWAALARQSGVHPLVAKLLWGRGVTTPQALASYLEPRLEDLYDPFLLKGMAEGAEAICQALEGQQRIVVSGDYDVDGITSTSLLVDFLRGAGGQVVAFIPNRFDHGYGLTGRTVAALQKLEPSLLVTVDNGITAIEEVAQLQQAGITTVITDHHLPRPEGVPPGIVINPLQPGCEYPYKRISGVGVAFKLIMALRKRLRERGWFNGQRAEPNLKDYLDLVAVGTVADMVPLLDENRVLVRHGLEVLNRQSKRPGIEALMALSRQNGNGPATPRSISFGVAPRINAAGRMAEGLLGVNLLLEADSQRAMELAQQLESVNDDRKALGEEMFRQARRTIEERGYAAHQVIVVESAGFHEGIVGITASRLVEAFQRPVYVLADNGDYLKGSARGVAGVNLTLLLEDCRELLTQWGGHAQAAGFTLPSANLEAFRQQINLAYDRRASQDEPEQVALDGELRLEEITFALVEQLQKLEPYGFGNEQPVFRFVPPAGMEPPQVFKDRHLKWRLPGNVEMLAWKQAPGFVHTPGRSFQVTLGFNEFRGQKKIQINVESMEE